MNLLKTKPRDYWRLSDWEALDLYAQRYKLSINDSYEIEREIDERIKHQDWINDEAKRR
jgi:hypothetical protein